MASRQIQLAIEFLTKKFGGRPPSKTELEQFLKEEGMKGTDFVAGPEGARAYGNPPPGASYEGPPKFPTPSDPRNPVPPRPQQAPGGPPPGPSSVDLANPYVGAQRGGVGEDEALRNFMLRRGEGAVPGPLQGAARSQAAGADRMGAEIEALGLPDAQLAERMFAAQPTAGGPVGRTFAPSSGRFMQPRSLRDILLGTLLGALGVGMLNRDSPEGVSPGAPSMIQGPSGLDPTGQFPPRGAPEASREGTVPGPGGRGLREKARRQATTPSSRPVIRVPQLPSMPSETPAVEPQIDWAEYFRRDPRYGGR